MGLLKNELTKQTVKDLFNKLNEITDREEREFKQYWLLQEVMSKYYNRCKKCVNSVFCWEEIGAIYFRDAIEQLCSHDAMVEVVRLREQTPLVGMKLGDTKHKKWHDEVKKMLEEAT